MKYTYSYKVQTKKDSYNEELFRINCEQYSMSIHISTYISTYHISTYYISTCHISTYISTYHISTYHTSTYHISTYHISTYHNSTYLEKFYIWVRYNISGWGISGWVDDVIGYTLHIYMFQQPGNIFWKIRTFFFLIWKNLSNSMNSLKEWKGRGCLCRTQISCEKCNCNYRISIYYSRPLLQPVKWKVTCRPLTINEK